MEGNFHLWVRRICLPALAVVMVLGFILFPIRAYAASLLRLGSVGNEVALLQQRLAQLGFNPGPVDGIFGPMTENAVKSFQRKVGLEDDGIVGPLTREALDRAAGMASTSRSAGPLRGRLIVVDPGHGGPEPGAISPWGDREKDFTLGIALRLRRQLEALGARVIMTRYGDYSPGSDWKTSVDELLARVSLANANNADLFVSIHINSYPDDPSVSGVMGFYRSGSYQSKSLASALAENISSATGLRFIDVRPGPYYVLNHTAMPAALMEVGFMTNKGDVALLRQASFLDSVAAAMTRGIVQYLGR